MVKYCGYYVTAQEVPNEISLVLSITNCPHHCEGCHSPWLQADIGDELTPGILERLIKEYIDGITCICFMGDGGNYEEINDYATGLGYVYNLKTCIYTGDDVGDDLSQFKQRCPVDYLKTGSYKKELGGLSSPTTNQRMWKRTGFTDDGVPIYEDITSWFWRKKE